MLGMYSATSTDNVSVWGQGWLFGDARKLLASVDEACVYLMLVDVRLAGQIEDWVVGGVTCNFSAVPDTSVNLSGGPLAPLTVHRSTLLLTNTLSRVGADVGVADAHTGVALPADVRT